MKISLIILASGYSKRFGENKLLHIVNDRPLYRHIIEATEKIAFFEKIIVTQYDEIMGDKQLLGYKKILNKNPELGISNSIHLGINSCDSETEGFCFSVSDQPYIKSETIKGLVEGFEKSKKIIGCIRDGNSIGNPNIFSRCFEKQLLELKGDKGAKKIILNENQNNIYYYDIEDNNELFDIDVKADV